jgi:hypothetical protein
MSVVRNVPKRIVLFDEKSIAVAEKYLERNELPMETYRVECVVPGAVMMELTFDEEFDMKYRDERGVIAIGKVTDDTLIAHTVCNEEHLTKLIVPFYQTVYPESAYSKMGILTEVIEKKPVTILMTHKQYAEMHNMEGYKHPKWETNEYIKWYTTDGKTDMERMRKDLLEKEITCNRKNIVIRDLKYLFNREVKFGSQHILILGDISYNKILGDRGIDFADDYYRMVSYMKKMGRDINFFKKIDSNAEMMKRMKDASEFVDFFCTSTVSNRLGKPNHRYKAARADQKMRLKYCKKCGLGPIPDRKHLLKGVACA